MLDFLLIGFVYCFSAWIPDDNIWPFRENKERFVLTHSSRKGFKEAVEAIEDVFKNMPQVIVISYSARE